MTFAKDIGIDLGTASVLVYVKGKGVVLNEPSVVAMDKTTGKLLKVGTDAQAMLGRTPGNIIAIRPLREGVISDYDMTERMLKEFIHKVAGVSFFKPRVIICVPSGITEVEERAVIDAGMKRVGVMGLAYCISAFMDCTIAASRGLGKTVVPTIIVILGSCVFRVIWVYTIFAHFHTIPSLYLLYPCSWILTAFAEILYFVHCYKDAMKIFKVSVPASL